MTKLLDTQILNGLPQEFPSWVLLRRLKDYSNPARKIASLVKNEQIVRIKRGWYCLGKDLSTRETSLPYLSSVLYGPSAVSLHYALCQYGLISEEVKVVTAVTAKRNYSLSTPYGNITWQHIPIGAFSVGLTRAGSSPDYLIAEPEKALMDLLWVTEWFPANQKKWTNYMFDDLRIDEDVLVSLDKNKLSAVIDVYKSLKLNRWMRWWLEWKNGQQR